MDTDAVLGVAPAEERCVYRNAKVVLLGDTGVGKSGLRLALTGEPYKPTDSTCGRRVWTLETIEKDLDGRRETRETLLWDMAGQPGYRLIHQLHLDEVAVALPSSTRQPTGIRWVPCGTGTVHSENRDMRRAIPRCHSETPCRRAG